jgi:tRNA(Ile)-lysidine synthase
MFGKSKTDPGRNERMNRLEKHISDSLGNDPFSHYFVACSGGVDSMVLLHILHKLGKRVSAMHVNYLLRGQDSENDQGLLEEVCQKMNVPCHVKRVDLNRYLLEKGGNLQEEARKVRYSYFGTFKLKRDFKIVLGHHADDQVETFFLNMARGSGIMGLACMLPEHKGYLRPLLPFSKEAIITYAQQNGVKWREDVSNSSNKYNRNKLRNVILPELKSAIPTLQESVLLLTRTFQETQQAIEISVKDIVQRIEKENALFFASFDTLNEFELMEILRQLDISVGVHSELLKLRTSEKGKRIDLEHEKYTCIVHEEDHFYFTGVKQSFEPPKLEITHVDRLPEKFSKDVIYLDPEKIKGNIAVRVWQAGDRMRPIGLKGSKLISDILTDAKVPNHFRSQQLVLHDDEKIIWCVGFAVGREAVATNGVEIVRVSVK